MKRAKTNIFDDISKEAKAVYQFLMSALKDYMYKNHFQKALVGLSGGIDSALTATIIADSIGAENLRVVMLPSKFNKKQSLIDAQILSHNIKCKSNIIHITAIYEAFLQNLFHIFQETSPNTTEENLQARIRMTLLMAISNKFHELLIATSNKSEASVGYATLYGDMSGGFALIKDLYKTQVYRLANWRNKNIPQDSKLNVTGVIPGSILKKEPSAELKHEQKDTDSLPPYNLLDKILYYLLEENLPTNQIASKLCINDALIKQIQNMVISSEFKRKQAPVGPEISLINLWK